MAACRASVAQRPDHRSPAAAGPSNRSSGRHDVKTNDVIRLVVPPARDVERLVPGPRAYEVRGRRSGRELTAQPAAGSGRDGERGEPGGGTAAVQVPPRAMPEPDRMTPLVVRL